jgi:hypothetical protein
MQMEQELQATESQREVCQSLIKYIGRQPLHLESDEAIINGWHWLRSVNKNLADVAKGLKAKIKEAKEAEVKEPVQPDADSAPDAA